MSDDDRAVMERLAALEAEVKADADAQKVRKEAALAKVREQRASQLAEKQALSARQAELVTKKKQPAREEVAARDDDDDGLGSALALAKKANNVKQELSKKGPKSWWKSGLASTALGPIGWLYAGSFRESIPAAAAWAAVLTVAGKIIPFFLLFPVLMVALPISGIAGVLYALAYNKKGGRQRLFDKSVEKKALKPG